MNDRSRTLNSEPPEAGRPLDSTVGPETASEPERTGRPLLPSEVLSAWDRFESGAEIARGGMGSVAEAYDTVLLRNVAIKTVHALNDGDAGDDDRLARFVEEAQITGQLDHPGIVPVHDLGMSRDRLRIVMKLVKGVTLGHVFEKLHGERLEQREVKRICLSLIRVCEAVAFAHDRGVIHRDLKPDNIMVGEHGELYVMDWGVALVKGTEARSVRLPGDAPGGDPRGIVGTVDYMAPEQALPGRWPIDERTDVYGLGGVIYYFLTGRAPHESQAPFQALDLAQSGRVPAVAEYAIWPNFPPGLAQIARKALAPDPADRYPSMNALKADLEQFLDGGGWFVTKSFTAGERIVVEGEPGDSAYIIVEGECDVSKSIGGASTIVRRMGPGDVFGETAVFTRKPRSATVIARTAVTLKVVTRESLEQELGQNPWMGAFVRALAERFRELDSARSS